MITALLIVIVVLLIGVLALMLTGWPGRERQEIEKTGRELRRELAQHRADSVQFLHAMRIELEESVRDTLEQEFASIEMTAQRAPSRQKKSSSAQRGMPSKLDEQGSDGEAVDGLSKKRSKNTRLQLKEKEQQVLPLPLFQNKKQMEETEHVASAMFLDDDIPDIEDIDNDLPDV